MFCKSCGKSVPDESRFCLHCGDDLATDEKHIVQNDMPPVAFKNTYFWTDVPRNIHTGWMFNRIERGYGLAFSLIDSDGRQTAADGKLVAAIILDGLHNTKLYSSDQKGLKKARKEATVVREFQIGRDSFSWRLYGNKTREWEDFTWEYRDFRDLISLTDVLGWHPHFWLMLLDGNLLYKKGDSISLG